ncbi:MULTISPECIES: hypothetical protein [unclassified Saccharopolyspora]|nr:MULTISPECIES: hypothetical protein [unclassified Saccharopolyspora]
MSTGSSILIMMAGMMVPILAAAPFYIADRRADSEQSTQDSDD